MKKLFLNLLVIGPFCLSASAQLLINGAGATFPAPIYLKWFSEYAKIDRDVQFNYQPIGSGGGQKQILSQTVDFGASDGPMSDANLAKAPSPIWHIPTVAGAAVVTYNLPGNPTLKFDGPTLAGIFLGKITKWDDPAITSQNLGVALGDQDILVVHRSDGSGTTYCFTDYLSTVSPEWKEEVGKNTAVQWPVGLGGKGSEGVTGQIKQAPGAIGYVELTYALQNKLAYAQVKNADGFYVTPAIGSIVAALGSASVPDDFRFSMVNAPGAKSYPIATASWLLVYQRQKDAAKGKKLVAFLKWAFTDGQKLAATLDYAPLPESVQARVLTRINQITF